VFVSQSVDGVIYVARSLLQRTVDQESEPGSNLLGLRCIGRAARDAVRTTRIAVLAWAASPRFAAYGS